MNLKFKAPLWPHMAPSRLDWLSIKSNVSESLMMNLIMRGPKIANAYITTTYLISSNFHTLLFSVVGSPATFSPPLRARLSLYIHHKHCPGLQCRHGKPILTLHWSTNRKSVQQFAHCTGKCTHAWPWFKAQHLIENGTQVAHHCPDHQINSHHRISPEAYS